jgi:hypothetical protein
MKRLLYSAIAMAAALAPVTAFAIPSPNPGLDSILAAAPSADWAEAATTTPGVFEGPFTAQQYVALGTSSNAAAAKATLVQDGFVAGFGRTWVLHSSQRALVEAVIAFTGASGAKQWLSSSQKADKADPTYQGSLTATGLDPYYGARYLNSTTNVYADAFVFVKGNDLFIVGSASAQDDKGAAAKAQALAQYKFAPAYTIPPSAWPKTAAPAAAPNLVLRLGQFVGGALPTAVLIGVTALTAALVLRSRRQASEAVPPGADTAQTVPPGHVELSPDRKSWWDGRVWRDASKEVPVTAIKSGDGAYWWDGASWRRVPPAS